MKRTLDLKKYTDVLKKVDKTKKEYLIRSCYRKYDTLTMAEIDELDRYRAAYALLSNLQKAEQRAEQEGWIDEEELEKELGVS